VPLPEAIAKQGRHFWKPAPSRRGAQIFCRQALPATAFRWKKREWLSLNYFIRVDTWRIGTAEVASNTEAYKRLLLQTPDTERSFRAACEARNRVSAIAFFTNQKHYSETRFLPARNRVSAIAFFTNQKHYSETRFLWFLSARPETGFLP
jgi:hypothetical protein